MKHEDEIIILILARIMIIVFVFWGFCSKIEKAVIFGLRRTYNVESVCERGNGFIS